MKNVRVHMPIRHSLATIGSRGRMVNIPTDLPVIFMGGPIRNAPDWRSSAIRVAAQKNDPVFLACPAHRIAEDLTDLLEPDKPEYETFPRQRAWEQNYLELAAIGAKRGCLFFWLCESALEEEFPGKVYAHITMLELGQWIERKKFFPETRLVIGTDGNFPEWPTVGYEIKTQLPDLPICRSLEETVNAALVVATLERRSK